MDCELDSEKLTRQEVFDNILNRKFKSQEPDVGKSQKSLVVVALILSILGVLIVCSLTIMSGYRNGPDEDDGFWEVYNEYSSTHVFISLLLLTILFLSVPMTIEYVLVMLDTMDDKDFF